MIFQNSLKGHRQAWQLLHKKASLNDADIAEIVNIDIEKVEQLRAEYDHLGAAATGNFWADRNKPTVTG